VTLVLLEFSNLESNWLDTGEAQRTPSISFQMSNKSLMHPTVMKSEKSSLGASPGHHAGRVNSLVD
jgi:hypothetical protein